MKRKVKNLFITVLSLCCMLSISGMTAFAAETSDMNPYSDQMTELSNSQSTTAPAVEMGSFYSWPGDGAAAPVTRMEITQMGTLNSNGNLCIVVKVYGYGRDYTTFDGTKITYVAQEPFSLSGPGADGFYYLFDCGVKPTVGHHTFYCQFTSFNYPGNTLKINYPFDLVAN